MVATELVCPIQWGIFRPSRSREAHEVRTTLLAVVEFADPAYEAGREDCVLLLTDGRRCASLRTSFLPPTIEHFARERA